MKKQRKHDIDYLGSAALAVITAVFLVTTARVYGQQQVPTQDARPQDGNNTAAQAPQRSHSADNDRLADLLAEELRLAQQLVKAFADKEQPLVILGSVHARGGQADQTFACWEKAVQMNPKRPDVYERMADLALQKDLIDKALSLWRKVLEMNPSSPNVHLHMATALMRQGKDQEAIAAIREEARISGNRPEDFYVLGQAYQHLQDYENAKENYLRAVALEPEHMNAFYGLYGVCARLKQPDEAKQYLERFQKLKDRQKETLRQADEKMMSDVEIFYEGLARFFWDAAAFGRTVGKSPDVEEVLRKAMALGQGNGTFLIRLAGFYAASNRLMEALALYLKASLIIPNDASCQLNMGLVLVRMDHLDKAEAVFRKAIELSPEHYAGYQELARLYLRMNAHLPEAGRLAQKAVDLEARADTYYDLGAARLMNGDPNGAMAAVRKALDLDPANPEYQQLLDVIRKKKGGGQ